MSNTENLKFWKSVQTTPPDQVKAGKIGQHNIKSVNPQWQRMQATEKFGMFGIGWGVEADSVKYEQITISESDKLLSYTANMFYYLDGVKGVFPIASTQPLCYMTKTSYLKTDHSADKKCATDALTKGLSFLGFSADIFMGLHDDWQYVQNLNDELEIASVEKAVDQKAEYKKWRQTVQAEILTCKTGAELEKLYLTSVKKAGTNNDAQLVNKLDELKNKRIEELKKKAEK